MDDPVRGCWTAAWVAFALACVALALAAFDWWWVGSHQPYEGPPIVPPELLTLGILLCWGVWGTDSSREARRPSKALMAVALVLGLVATAAHLPVFLGRIAYGIAG